MYDCYDEGIRALELRYAPSFVSMNHNHDFSDVLDAIEHGIQDAVKDLSKRHEEPPIGVGILCIGVGAMGDLEMDRTVDFFLKNQDRFVGFDMAGAETNVSQFEPQFRKIRDSGAHITCHASEDRVDGVPENALCAVELLGAERIGHGIQIAKDKEIMRKILDHDVMLEISVTSNYLTNAVDKISNHPASMLWDFGIPLCVNTDDPGIMAIDLNHEWDVWIEDLKFKERDLRAMNMIALDRSFLPKQARERLYHDFFRDDENERGFG